MLPEASQFRQVRSETRHSAAASAAVNRSGVGGRSRGGRDPNGRIVGRRPYRFLGSRFDGEDGQFRASGGRTHVSVSSAGDRLPLDYQSGMILGLRFDRAASVSAVEVDAG